VKNGGGPPRQKLPDNSILDNSILDNDYNDAKDMFEKAYLEYQYGLSGGAVPRMAQKIGIYPSNLYMKLRKYKITG
jgi:DNA-binding NtrC family response regulator